MQRHSSESGFFCDRNKIKKLKPLLFFVLNHSFLKKNKIKKNSVFVLCFKSFIFEEQQF